LRCLPKEMMTKFKIQVSCLPACERGVKKLVFDILADYCERFSVLCLEGKFLINICFIEYGETSDKSGCTYFVEEQNKIHIQLRDPMLNDWESNPYTMNTFMNVLCHEIVHACQHLTGRNGFKIPQLTYDSEDEGEEYFFDPAEIEARVLADFYRDKFANKLLP